MNRIEESGDFGWSPEQVRQWKDAVRKRRSELFRSGWRNRRKMTKLLSREDEDDFVLLIEWCEEYRSVVTKYRERLSDPDPRIKAGQKTQPMTV